MASLQRKGGGWYCQFISRGKRHTFALGGVTEAEANAKAAQVEYILMRLKQGLIALPAGCNIVEFVRHDGSPPAVAVPASVESKELTLAEFRDRYLNTHANGTLESHTLTGIRRHFGHLVRSLGEGLPIHKLRLADLQGYVDERAKAKGRRGTVLPVTIKKEIVTLKIAWNWAARMQLVAGRCPADGLRYSKSDEKPPFQSRAEIER